MNLRTGIEAHDAILDALPQYTCHKVVRAARINTLSVIFGEPGAKWAKLEGAAGLVKLPAAWIMRHAPEKGGYLVVYEDGYASYSPAEAFEAGYERTIPVERELAEMAPATVEAAIDPPEVSQ